MAYPPSAPGELTRADGQAMQAKGWLNQVRETARLARAEYIGFSCVSVLGALAVQGSRLPLAVALWLFCVGAVTAVWSMVHNDLCDLEIDRASAELSERPLLKGTVPRSRAILLVVTGIGASLLLAARLWPGPLPLLLLSGSILMAVLYNALGKRLAGADVFFAASMALLCLLGACVADAGHLPRGEGAAVAWITVAIVFVDHLSFNIIGTFKDVRNDAQTGAVTLPLVLGVHEEGEVLRVSAGFRALLLGLKLVTVLLVLLPCWYAWVPCAFWQGLVLSAAAILALALTLRLLHVQAFDRARIVRLSIQEEMASKLLLPVMLAAVIGGPWLLVLVLGPPLWFSLASRVLYGHFMRAQRSF